MLRKNKCFFALVLIILSFSFSVKIDAQVPISKTNFNTFNVKKGDSSIYQFDNIQIGSNPVISINNLNTTLTDGSKADFTIVDKNISSFSGLNTVYFNESLQINNSNKDEITDFPIFSVSAPLLNFAWLTSPVLPNIITYGFNDAASAKEYFNKTITQFYSMEPGQFNISTNSSNLKVFYKSNPYLPIIQVTTTTWNYEWRTGWLESYIMDSKYVNGTNITHYELHSLYNTDTSSNTSNFNSTTSSVKIELSTVAGTVAIKNIVVGAFAGVVIVASAIAVLIGLSYKKYTKKFEHSTQRITFKDYIVRKVKFNNKSNRKKVDLASDKTFEMLEELIEETK